MTNSELAPLTDLEKDALSELSNIAMARAATSLRAMVGHEVSLSVPAVDVISREYATKLVGKDGKTKLVAVRQDFLGAFSGRALLIFPEDGSLELVRAVVGKQLSVEDIIDLEDESLAETGNIILNSWVATIANLLKRSLSMSLPIVIRGDGRQIFEPADVADTRVLFLHITFEIKMRKIRGYVALLMDIPSVEELRMLIAEFIVNVIHRSEPGNANT